MQVMSRWCSALRPQCTSTTEEEQRERGTLLSSDGANASGDSALTVSGPSAGESAVFEGANHRRSFMRHCIASWAVWPTVATLLLMVVAPAGAGSGAQHRATHEAMLAVVRGGVPGVTTAAADAQGSWSAAAGVGDLRTGKPRSARDRYRVGSITKTFIATVLLQLEAEGELSLDDRVDKWAPGLVEGGGNSGRRISLRQLLNHTSGIFNYSDDGYFARAVLGTGGFFRNRYKTVPLHRLIDLAMQHEPDFPSGTSWNYSNTNYLLAGKVIEEITGRSYGEEIRRRIIDPLRLRATSLPGSRVTVPQPSSRSYSRLGHTATGQLHDVTELNPSIAGPAGEMISNSADLSRFYSALLRGQLLPRKQLAEMTSTVPAWNREGYGLGLTKRVLSCGITVWGHDGRIHGSVSIAAVTSDGRHALAVNFNGDWAAGAARVIEAEFCG
ncbi:serine hydrolase domain-containing protein [Streptomyces sp. NPDC048171]|uniref:serine hydrolase domain-containing protein n=1 Tax=Streptomyces sp. NPDC048171 TaxID=3365504 RepID=UPI00371C4742